MANVIPGDLIDIARSGRILQIINAQGYIETKQDVRKIGHSLFSTYENLHDDLQGKLSDNADENFAETISVRVKPNLIIDSAVVMYEPNGEVDENLLVHIILKQAKVAEQAGDDLCMLKGLGDSLDKAGWDRVYDRIKHISNITVVRWAFVEHDDEDDKDDDIYDRLFAPYPYPDSYKYPYDDRDDDGSEFE